MVAINKLVYFMAIAIWSTQALEISVPEGPVLHPQCPQVDDPMYPILLPYPQDCSKYYSCANGYAYAKICPDNFHFSPLTHRCDYPHIAQCQQQVIVSIPVYPTGPVLAPAPFLPPSTVVGNPIYQNYPNDCNHYYQCQPMRCPANYHWNSQRQQCDLPAVAQCPFLPLQTPPVVPISYPPIIPTIPLVPSVEVSNYPGLGEECIECASWCLGQGHVYLPYPQDCRKFIQCNGLAFVHKCPNQLLWNDRLKACDRDCIRNDNVL